MELIDFAALICPQAVWLLFIVGAFEIYYLFPIMSIYVDSFLQILKNQVKLPWMDSSSWMTMANSIFS